MCTLSIIASTQPASRGRALACGFRVITNRDEMRTRPPATPPRWHDPHMSVVPAADPGAAALFPVDPAGGGTWVGAAPSGLVLCLLNANVFPPPELPDKDQLLSRGVVIPRLLGAHASGGLDAVMDSVAELELPRFAPFRLVGMEMTGDPDAAHPFRVREATWDRAALTHEATEPGPVCFVSSALGDLLVKPRLALFEAMVRGPFTAPGQGQTLAQDRFHRHVWPGREDVSVIMTRPDARTVSITSVDVQCLPALDRGPVVSMRYEAVPDVQPVTRPLSPRSALDPLPIR